MTLADLLGRAKELSAAATAGPWFVEGRFSCISVKSESAFNDGGKHRCVMSHPRRVGDITHDADFAAFSRNHLDRLVHVIEHLSACGAAMEECDLHDWIADGREFECYKCGDRGLLAEIDGGFSGCPCRRK